jgi:hypothetical protein
MPPTRPHRFTARGKLVRQMQDRLQAQSWPRLQMSLIVAFTGLAGLLLSAVLVRLGVHHMGWRYPLVTLLAYGAFLGLLWVWMRTRPDDWGDVADGVDVGTDVMDMASAGFRVRGGGSGGSMPSSGPVRAPGLNVQSAEPVSSSSSGGSGGLDLGDVADADELAVVVLVIVAVVALASAGAYIVVQAPTLLAEVALDGAVAGSLYHRLHQAERQHWAHSAWQYTRWPLIILVLTMAVVGWGLQNAAPGAHTLGQALSMWGTHTP